MIYDVDIHDPTPCGEFMEQVKPLVEAFGGNYLARVGQHEVLQGEWKPTRLVPFSSDAPADHDSLSFNAVDAWARIS